MLQRGHSGDGCVKHQLHQYKKNGEWFMLKSQIVLFLAKLYEIKIFTRFTEDISENKILMSENIKKKGPKY